MVTKASPSKLITICFIIEENDVVKILDRLTASETRNQCFKFLQFNTGYETILFRPSTHISVINDNMWKKNVYLIEEFSTII